MMLVAYVKILLLIDFFGIVSCFTWNSFAWSENYDELYVLHCTESIGIARKNSKSNDTFKLTLRLEDMSDCQAHFSFYHDNKSTIELEIGEHLGFCSLYKRLQYENLYYATCNSEFHSKPVVHLDFEFLPDGVFILKINNINVLTFQFREPLNITHVNYGCRNKSPYVVWKQCQRKPVSSIYLGGYDYSWSNDPEENLKKHLFGSYHPHLNPNGNKNKFEIVMNFQIQNILLEDDKGELKMYGVADMKWMDSKMKWKIEEYRGIYSFLAPSAALWTPNLRVLNSIASDTTYPQLLDLESSGVRIFHNGSVSWRPLFASSSFCWPDFKDWPMDTVDCVVRFGFWMEPPNALLVIMYEYDKLQTNRAEGKWKVREVIPFNGDFSDPDSFGGLRVVLQRKDADNIFFFYIIYIVAVSLSLSSFWVSSYTSYKLNLICGSIILLLLVLFSLGYNISKMPKDVPKLILIYSWTTVIACFPLLVFVTLKNLPKSIPDSLSNLLDHAILDRMFCLTVLPENPSQCADLNMDENKLTKVSLKVARLANLIERFSFFVYLILLFLPFVLM